VAAKVLLLGQCFKKARDRENMLFRSVLDGDKRQTRNNKIHTGNTDREDVRAFVFNKRVTRRTTNRDKRMKREA
jgi:hypothetical protein